MLLYAVGIDCALGLSEILLNLAFELIHATLDVLTRIIGSITNVTTNLAFQLFRTAFDFVFEAFSFQIATDNQEETDRYWNAIVGNGGQESACGWCKDRWGLSWQITPRALTDALAAGGGEAKRAFDAMMSMKKVDIATIEAARRG